MRYSPCASADELLEGLQGLEALAKKRLKKLSTRVAASIKTFNDRLQPYFEVVNTFIQSNPQYTALMWGALRLILQLASNFVTFFEKLVTVLERLIESFPQYAMIADLCKDKVSTRMKSHLENVYLDIFQFFQSVARVFTNSRGGLRKTPIVIGELLWKPFNVRFDEVLGRMAHHRDLVNSELDIIRAQAANDAEAAAAHERSLEAKERYEAEKSRRQLEEHSRRTNEAWKLIDEGRKDETYREIRHWISAPNFAETLQNSQELREDGTNNWLFKNKIFSDWRTSPWSPKSTSNQRKTGGNVLWIHGNPGSGKTVLASSVVKELQDCRSGDTDTADVGYYFFKLDSPTLAVASAAYSSILTQILHTHRRDEAYMNKFAFAMSSAAGGQERATSLEVVDLLHICLQELRNIYLIIDGVDECDDNTKLMRDIHSLSTRSNTKVLLFSRRSVVSLNRMVPKNYRLPIDRNSVSDDIGLYLTTQIGILVDDDLLPQTADAADLVAHLVKGADGMFLWARPMSAYLNSPALTQAMRVRTIMDVILPEGLDAMYNRILGLIAQTGPTERDLAQRILVWLTFAIRPLTYRELNEALTVKDNQTCKDYSNQFSDLQETIAIVCGGLVERTTSSYAGGNEEFTFRFIHLSVKEYFTKIRKASNPAKSSQGLLLPSYLAHLDIFRYCAQHLMAQTHQELGSVNSSILKNSFTAYASCYWMDHLAEIPIHLDLFDPADVSDLEWVAMQTISTLGTMLNSPRTITFWLNVYYCVIPPGPELVTQHPRYELIHRFAAWIQQLPPPLHQKRMFSDMYSTLEEFAMDIETLIKSWGEQLIKSPSIIWDEVPAFLKSSFLMKSDSTKVTSLSSQELKPGLSSSKPLCDISATAVDGKFNGVLTIWPSRAYEKQWNQLQPQSPYSFLLPLCSGWTARYEVWSIEGEPARLFDIRIPLRESEISLQMRQSFRQDSSNDWKTSFPLAISDDALSFVILRTLFKISTSSSGMAGSLLSFVIPMDFLGASAPKWTDQLQQFNPSQLGIANLPPGLHFLHHDWYSYYISFSSNGRYLFFSDRIRTLPPVYHLAVFEIHVSEHLCAELIGSGSFETFFGPSPMITNVAFHPRCPFIVYWNRGSVLLWHFQKPISEAIELAGGGPNPPDAITISSCGKYVVVTQERTSKVISIPNKDLNLLEVPRKEPEPYDDRRYNENSVAQIGKMDLSNFGLRPGHVLKGTHLSIQPGQTGHKILSISADGSVIVRAMDEIPSGVVEKMELVQVPQNGGGAMAASLIVPYNHDDKVRIVANCTPREAYSMSTSRKQGGGSFIVDRDLRSIRYAFDNSHSSSIAESSPQKRADLGTSPHLNKVLELADGEKSRALDAAKESRESQEPTAKRFKFSYPQPTLPNRF
ncbi:hypothetical protein AOQ84DRAFT_42671 [Glonium stellatum]|uniref:NACHT domain-containing protein n=1 Tax=Glonium stellatum TaxID=574774 RepID=A0A8E2F0J4_9PEZI|nr:hypothetical protein AOQ84DRAFT_42671 [Glonium stellatum]